MNLVLASASPARRTLLAAAGIDAHVIVSGVDESSVGSSNAETLCAVLARMKALAVAERVRRAEQGIHLPAGRVLVLGCDSVLDFEGKVLGKPDDAQDARDRWHAMRGKSGVLRTGHFLVDLDRGKTAEAVASTTVHFSDVTDDEIEAYVGTGEPLHVAGAFTLDGLGGPFVSGIDGDPSTVIGLSLPTFRRLLAELDLTVMDLWRRS
ncbi:Maf family protein [Hamadaea tsunoensis]|uniref:Maf family protein n=1 Tax=Hamadaea tsunoensis TaxID=53368 RepID=UPI000420A42D|nr:nucleoside triphosphate pyrophosphatase [Hamadaea tsunoensis]